jgi:hypothetical protein
LDFSLLLKSAGRVPIQQLLQTKSTGGILLSALITREYNILREQLRSWCQAGRGRQKKIAEALGVSKQLVSGWLSGHRIMSLNEWLQIQAFQKKQRRAKPRDAAPGLGDR